MAAAEALTVHESGTSRSDLWLRFRSPYKVEHCRQCMHMRMVETARQALALGIETFTTSLLVSPWQNRELIVAAGEAAASAYGLRFLAADWRLGYREGQAKAREAGLYRQKYCGCLYSLNETDVKFRDRYLADFALTPADLPVREA